LPKQPRMRRFGYGEKMDWGWRMVWAIMYPAVSAIFSIRWRHIERMPQHGGIIVVVNHVSHVDPLIVAKFMIDAGRTPRFMAKESIFYVPFIGWAMRAMQHIPVKRDTADAPQALLAAVEKLRAGACVVMHPEGTVTRDPDAWPMSAKTGIARLALLAPEVPVVPVAQWGVQEQIDLYNKKVRFFPRPRHVLSVGEPIDLSQFKEAKPTPEVLRKMSDMVMKRLRTDVAALRAVPAPTGELFVWTRPKSRDQLFETPMS
jgi:1-acyl-sn-glycerol-3-phosphate acyltransferase